MEYLRKFNQKKFVFEYGLDGKRLLPWPGLNLPFGGAFCKVMPGTETLPHVNSPEDEEEIFIVISGSGQVVIDSQHFDIEENDIAVMPSGTRHYVINPYDQPLCFYALWWNSETAESYLTKSNHWAQA